MLFKKILLAACCCLGIQAQAGIGAIKKVFIGALLATSNVAAQQQPNSFVLPPDNQQFVAAVQPTFVVQATSTPVVEAEQQQQGESAFWRFLPMAGTCFMGYCFYHLGQRHARREIVRLTLAIEEQLSDLEQIVAQLQVEAEQ